MKFVTLISNVCWTTFHSYFAHKLARRGRQRYRTSRSLWATNWAQLDFSSIVNEDFTIPIRISVFILLTFIYVATRNREVRPLPHRDMCGRRRRAPSSFCRGSQNVHLVSVKRVEFSNAFALYVHAAVDIYGCIYHFNMWAPYFCL